MMMSNICPECKALIDCVVSVEEGAIHTYYLNTKGEYEEVDVDGGEVVEYKCPECDEELELEDEDDAIRWLNELDSQIKEEKLRELIQEMESEKNEN